MKFHALANLFPLMEGREFDELVADIEAHGCREPIYLLDNQILDGRNRWRACEKLGARPTLVEYEGDDALAFVVSLNLRRRQLTDGQKAVLALDLLPLLEEQARERQGARNDIVEIVPQSQQGKSRDQAAVMVGTNARYVSDAKKLKAEAPELLEKVRAGEISLPAAKAQARDNANKAQLSAPIPSKLPGGLHVGDFRALSDQIADDSVELVFIDPPYDRDSFGLYEDAARIASRILKPGGSLIAYCGQYGLPTLIPSMSKHLRFWWLNACVHSGREARMREYGIVVGWKPLLWFVKDHRGDKQAFVSDVVSGGREKDAHDWQQAEAEAAYYIDSLTSPHGLVVDFFCGGGTTAAAAQALGRPWLTFELNPITASRAADRLQGKAA